MKQHIWAVLETTPTESEHIWVGKEPDLGFPITLTILGDRHNANLEVLVKDLSALNPQNKYRLVRFEEAE